MENQVTPQEIRSTSVAGFRPSPEVAPIPDMMQNVPEHFSAESVRPDFSADCDRLDYSAGLDRLDFSDNYAGNQAERYHAHHQKSWFKRLSNRRELAVARQALEIAGDPKVMLDLPCGTGRFWPVLTGAHDGTLLAMDASSAMLETAIRRLPESLAGRVQAFRGNAFDLRLADHSVDAVFCMRFLHHLEHREDRMALLEEFHRVTRQSVIISLWVDGNLQAASRRLRGKRSRGRYVIAPKTIEDEFRSSGFTIAGHFDLLSFCSMWRTYVLRRLPGSQNRMPV